MSYIIESPFPSFNDTDGSPLNNGYVYVGSANLNPVTDPIPVYWDEALTQPAAQPIRTINGYLSRNGSPGRIYTSFVTYSFRVTNNKGEQVFSDLNYTDPTSNAGSTYQQVITAIAGQTVFNLSRTYIPGTNNLFVYRNGLRLIAGQDYNETGYSQVTLTAGADNGDEFVFDIGYNYDSAASVDAQDVTYKLPAVDSVFTNVEAKLSETVSMNDFGAVGDGTTDDTAAIQAALNTGRVVYLPEGTYQISSALTITQNNTGIRGDGFGSVIRTTSATEDVFTIGDGTNEISGLLFSDFVVWSTVTKSSGFAFNNRFITDSTWSNVSAGTIDLYVANSNAHRLFDGFYFNRFSQCSIEGGQVVVSNDGIKARGNSDQSFGAELSVDGGLRIYKAGGKGVYLGGACGGVYLDRVDLSECYRGVYMDSLLAGITNREVFLESGLTIDSCTGWGVNVEANGVALLEADGPWVSACGSVATGEGGIKVAPSAGVSARWSNLRVNYCYYDGVQINDGAHVFSGGYIRNCGTGSSGGNGLTIAALSQATVTGMMIHNNGNATRGYGIRIEGTVTNYNIQSNSFFGNGQLAIYQPSGPDLNKIIRDNRGWVTENSGTANIANGTTSVVVNHGLADVPTLVQVTAAGAQDAGAYWFVAPSSFTATQFTLTYSMIATAQRDFFWRATRGQA